MHSPSELTPSDVKRVLEAGLLASQGPVSLPGLKRLFDEGLSPGTLRKLLVELAEDWKGRAVELVNVASGWRFQTAAEFQPYIERLNPGKPPRSSRAVMETRAIISYRQPVTRGDIEDIRGVGVSTQIIQTLEARGWIDTVGHRETPGRPALYATRSTIRGPPRPAPPQRRPAAGGDPQALDPGAGTDRRGRHPPRQFRS